MTDAKKEKTARAAGRRKQHKHDFHEIWTVDLGGGVLSEVHGRVLAGESVGSIAQDPKMPTLSELRSFGRRLHRGP